LTVEANRLEIFVKEDAGAIAGEIAFVIENDEVEFSIFIEIGGEWGGTPLSFNFSIERFFPEALGCVAKDFDFGANRVVENVVAPVAIPVRDGESGITPLGFGGALNGSVFSGKDAESFAVGF